MSQTRDITVTLREIDRSPIHGARVEIRLVEMGIANDGFISPGTVEMLTDENGQAVFTLWQNTGTSYYEVRSWNPVSGQAIHRRDIFYVGSNDANLEDLIGVGSQAPDLGGHNANPDIGDLSVTLFGGERTAILLGPEVDDDQDAIFYSIIPSVGVRVFGNVAEILVNAPGTTSRKITAIDGRGGRATAQLSINTLDLQLHNTVNLNGVVVQ